jgi:hypothetical protein
MNGYEKEKEQNYKKNAAGTLVVMMNGKRGEASNDEEELAWNKLDDDNNYEAATKQRNNIIEHDINCVVDTNKGEKEGVDINNEEGKEEDNEFDIDSLYNHEYDYMNIDGTGDGTSNVMIASEHGCDYDRKREHNKEIRDNNDNYNDDDGGGGGSVVGNNNANLVTIPMSALIDLSGEKEEENNYTDIAQIDIKGTLSKAINQNKSQQPLNGTSSNSNSSNSEGSTNHRKYVTPGKLWYDKLSVVQ